MNTNELFSNIITKVIMKEWKQFQMFVKKLHRLHSSQFSVYTVMTRTSL